MIPGYHDQEKFVQAHRQNLLREAEHERLLAQLPAVGSQFHATLPGETRAFHTIAPREASRACKAPQAANN